MIIRFKAELEDLDGFVWKDTYTFDTRRFWSDDINEMYHYMLNDMLIVAGGGYRPLKNYKSFYAVQI